MEALLPMLTAEIYKRHLSSLAEAEKIMRCGFGGSGLRVRGSGFGVQGSGFGVQGSGFG